jgi:CheY-like chemotaxis protein
MSRILVVEDDPDIQDYLAIFLTERGHSLVRAFNGREALEQLALRSDIDLVLLDMIMPVMDGEEFFRRLRLEARSDVPVILISVNGATADRLRQIGPLQGFFRKGLEAEALCDMVDTLLSTPPEP